MANLTEEQLAQLSADYQSLAKQLLKYKLDHAADMGILEFQDLSSRISLIVQNSNLMAALAAYQASENISAQLTDLTQATKDIGSVLEKIKRVQEVIDIATTIVNIGTSVLSFDVGGVINGISTLVSQIHGLSEE